MKPPLLVATRAVVPEPSVRVSPALELDPLADATGKAPPGLDEDDAVLSIGGTFSLPPPCLNGTPSCLGSSDRPSDGEEDDGMVDVPNWAGEEDEVWSSVMDDDRGSRSAYPSENRRFFSVCRLFWN